MLTKAVKGLIRLSTVGHKCGHRMTRYRMYFDIKDVMDGIDQSKLGNEVLDISRSWRLVEGMKLKSPNITLATWPQENILKLSYPDESFDYIACDQILEHVQGDPQQAVNELQRVLKPGGIAVLTTCLIQEPHGLPHDYWRFSRLGLKHLFRNYSSSEAGSWGNKIAFLGFRYYPVPHAKWHPINRIAMKNDPLFPMMTWIVARK